MSSPFEHYCHCGKWGAFGTGVRLQDGKIGTWHCFEHWTAERRIEFQERERLTLSTTVPDAPAIEPEPVAKPTEQPNKLAAKRQPPTTTRKAQPTAEPDLFAGYDDSMFTKR